MNLVYHRLYIKTSYKTYQLVSKDFFAWREHGQASAGSEKNYRTSTPIGSGLNSHMMKFRLLIGAHLIKIKTLYIRETASCVR